MAEIVSDKKETIKQSTIRDKETLTKGSKYQKAIIITMSAYLIQATKYRKKQLEWEMDKSTELDILTYFSQLFKEQLEDKKINQDKPYPVL